MIIVMGHIRVRADDAERLQRRLVAHEETVRASEGCLHYSISPDSGSQGRLWVMERWRDKPAQANHLASDYMAAFNRMMMGSVMSGADVQMFLCDQPGEWLLRV